MAISAMTIMSAVNSPYEANSGIGAKARMPNPTAELTAEVVPVTLVTTLDADPTETETTEVTEVMVSMVSGSEIRSSINPIPVELG